ncbi:MAG: hypothetical protein QNK37_14275 [Acidobacteriota bacterium]|nr:hypothetical protein [Acidobacteriota bacterium]
MPVCWIIAGPNGAGKTTFAMKYLPRVAQCTHFINADLIAAGLSPLAPERELVTASRLLLREIDARITACQDFAFETTLAGRGYLRLIKRLKAAGWQVELLYLALPSLEMSRFRVAERVAHGGHHISEGDLKRRFPRSLDNLLTKFSYAVDHCACFMNNGDSPVPIFEQRGEHRTVVHEIYFQQLLHEAGK